MESDHMAVKLDKQATSYTSYTDLLPRPIPPTYDCSNYHIAPVGPQPSPLQLGKESRQRFTNVLTLCLSHLTFDTFCTCSYLVILTHKCADRSEGSEFWFRLPSVVMLVRSRPLLGLMIVGNWRLSFFTSTSHFQDLLGTPGGSGPSHFCPFCWTVWVRGCCWCCESQVLGCSVARQRDGIRSVTLGVSVLFGVKQIQIVYGKILYINITYTKMWINLERYGLIWVTYESVWIKMVFANFAWLCLWKMSNLIIWWFWIHLNSFDVRFVSVSVPGVQRGPPQLSPETLGAAAPGDKVRFFTEIENNLI